MYYVVFFRETICRLVHSYACISSRQYSYFIRVLLRYEVSEGSESNEPDNKWPWTVRSSSISGFINPPIVRTEKAKHTRFCVIIGSRLCNALDFTIRKEQARIIARPAVKFFFLLYDVSTRNGEFYEPCWEISWFRFRRFRRILFSRS